MRFKIILLVILLLILKIYSPWFTTRNLSAGDWPYLFPKTISEFSFFSYQPLTWVALYYQITAKILSQYLRLSWGVTEKLVWFWPFLLISFFSSWFLMKTIFPKFKKVGYLACPIYLSNTYILMLVSGGQMGVALAYSLIPLVLGLFVDLLVNPKLYELKKIVLVGLALAIQLMFDPRVTYISLIGVSLYWLINFKISTLLQSSFALIIPCLVALLLNFYWILPIVITRNSEFNAYTQVGWVGFLSFVRFSESLSLLHPNWPENIFGKTYLMQPGFLILPILAFSSLLFVGKQRGKENKIIIFFALIALLGAFLAKGSNPPFGEIYLWLFKNFPLMNLFRDSSKFYSLVALSYSVLIPYTILKL